MEEILNGLVFVILSFLCGSIPVGYIVVKRLKGVDLRKFGSGNVGATNVYRAGGLRIAIAVFILDVVKSALPVALAKNFGTVLACICGIVAILGHSFTPWLSFRGGRGVAPAVGVFLVLAPYALLLSTIAFALVFKLTKIVSCSSIVAAVTLPIWIKITTKQMEIFLLGTTVMALVILRHIPNIKRLIKRQEYPLSSKCKEHK